MIYELGHWDQAYKRLLTNIRASRDETLSSVLILCAMDADALCAARILSYLLRADSIPYQLRPCPSHTSLIQILSGLKKKEEYSIEYGEEDEEGKLEVGCVVMLNIGGMINLNQFYASKEDQEPILPMSTLTFVMDCHRPWHLANIHAGENIILFKEDPLEDDIPSDGDGLSGNESESDSDDESDTDGEDESDDEEKEKEEDDEQPPFKKRRTILNEEDDADDEQSVQDLDEHSQQSNPQDIDNLQDDDENASHSTPTSSIHTPTQKSLALTPPSTPPHPPPPAGIQTPPSNLKLSFRQLQKMRRDRISDYYHSGSYFRSPVSWIAYTLCRQLRFGDLDDLLWLACVGVTDSFLHSRLDRLGYSHFVKDLRRHIQRLFPEDGISRAMQANYAQDGTQVGVSENGRIQCQTEFRFMLLRHWSLLDAMVHSNFVGTKLQIWKEQGRFRLTEMLAKMGFPLQQCKQPWAFMNPKLKRVLRQAVLDNKEDFDLNEIDYTGFIRVSGYKSTISASDMSYAITALLETETPVASNLITEDSSALDISHQHDDPVIIQSFNIAYDALNAKSAGSSLKSEGSSLSNLVNGGDLSGSEGLGAGIRLAMQLQKSIISAAVGLVDKNAITRLKHFRYAYLYASGSSGQEPVSNLSRNARKNSSSKDPFIFSRPLALCKLAHFLMDMHRDKWVNKNARPLVLLAEKPKTNTFLVVGYNFAQYEGDMTKNTFRKFFQYTAKSMEGLCHVRLDTFEGNAVEVEAGGEHRFIEQLHYLMDVL